MTELLGTARNMRSWVSTVTDITVSGMLTQTRVTYPKSTTQCIWVLGLKMLDSTMEALKREGELHWSIMLRQGLLIGPLIDHPLAIEDCFCAVESCNNKITHSDCSNCGRCCFLKVVATFHGPVGYKDGGKNESDSICACCHEETTDER